MRPPGFCLPLAQLATTDKSSLVGAINELNGKMGIDNSFYNYLFSVDVTDLNNPPKAPIFATATSPTGFPSNLGGNRCLVLYLNAGNVYRTQLAIGFSSDKIAFRRKVGVNWTEWKYFTAS